MAVSCSPPSVDDVSQIQADCEFFKTFIGMVPAQPSSDVDMDDIDVPADTGVSKTESHKQKNKRKKKAKKTDPDKREELRKKVHARIQELTNKPGKLSSDETQEQKRLRRRADKLKSKRERKKKNVVKPNAAERPVPVKVSPASKKPVFNKDGKMVFSKFDFTDVGEKDRRISEFVGKDYKSLLEKVAKRKDKIAKLKETDADAGKKFEEKVSWMTAISRAQGEKVKDNPEQLKKAAKRKDHLKEKRKKKWKDRESNLNERMKEKQNKRQANINARKDSKKASKMKKLTKKGRMIPGF